MNKTIYNYHPQTNEFLNEVDADDSPLEPGVIVLPAFSTTAKPPKTAAREVAVFADGEWQIKADWRGVPLFSTGNGSAVMIVEIGKTPADVGATEAVMPSPAHAWVDGAWVLDPVKEQEVLSEAKTSAMRAIEALHAATLRRAVGNPTTEETASWERKLNLAKAVLAGQPLDMADEAYLSGRGFDASRRAEWANSVMVNATAYMQSMAWCDSFRTQAQNAIARAQDIEQINSQMADLRISIETVLSGQ